MKPRSDLPEVRNPILRIQGVLDEWEKLTPNERQALINMLNAICRIFRVEGDKAWKKSKYMMGSYWKVFAVYARHLALSGRAKPAPLLCGRVFDGYPCTMPAGTKCPDCGPAVHDVPEGS